MKAGKILLALAGASLAAGCSLQNENAGGTDNTVTGAEVDRVEMGEKAITKEDRTDNWTAPEGQAAGDANMLTLPVSESEPVRISFDEREEKGLWDSYKGGAECEYAFASIDENETEGARLIIDGYNEWAIRTMKDEVAAAKERWERYNRYEPDSFIALTPWVGMKLTRSDTSIISFVTTIKRYNRDYEPDDDFLYSHTYDARSGKELTLSDFVTDREKLSEVLLRTLETKCSGYSEERKQYYFDEGFQKKVRESLLGDRNDGLFAWSLSPEGFVFYLANPFYKEDYLYYQVEDVIIPFDMCSEILAQDLYAPYDYITAFPKYYLKETYGDQWLPEKVGGKSWYSPYSVSKDGQDYLYLSGDDEMAVYKVTADGPEYVGSVIGELEYNNHYTYESVIDTHNIGLKTSTILLVELLNLRTTANIGKDGMPEYNELFTPEYNIFPMRVLKDFQAEVFSDENDKKPSKKKLEEYTELYFLRTDGESFIDLEIEGDKGICRLYITGSYEDGFQVNGLPADEYIETEVFFEE